MKILFIIPEIFFVIVDTVVRDLSPKIHAEYLFYKDYKETPILIKNNQTKWDGIIFAGRAPYFFCMQHIVPEVLWSYFPTEGSTFCKALFSATSNGWDIHRISTDSYNFNAIKDYYPENFSQANVKRLEIYQGDVADFSHNENTIEFHIKNYKEHRASGCITPLYTVAEKLKEEGIPTILANPTYDSIRNQICFMQRLYNAQCQSNKKFVVYSINIDYPDESFLNSSSEYQYAVEYRRIAEQIYQYAESIQGAVSEISSREYMLFSDTQSAHFEPQNLSDSFLFNNIRRITSCNVRIGIGCAANVLTAQQQALQAQIRARSTNSSSILYQFPGEDKSGLPFTARSILHADIQDKIFLASQKSQLSSQYINRIHRFVNERNNKNFTAEELAAYLDLGIRSTNRILEKLESAGYITICGQIETGKKGRPKRLLRFEIE